MANSRQTYTVEQLKKYKQEIDKNGVDAAVNFYSDMYDSGYNYAGWARGVARNDTVTGKSAIDYLNKTARQGVGGITPKQLTTTDLNNIKKDMAIGYVNTLIQNANETRGVTNQDVTYEQTRNFHKQAFERNGLSIENWTLETPMKVIEGFEGKDAVEKTWIALRETGGDGPDGIYRSNGLYDRMERIVNTSHILMTDEQVSLQQQAREWLERVGGRVTWDNITKIWDSIMSSSNQLGGSQQANIMAISIAPSFNYTSHKKDSVAGFTLYQVLNNAVDTAIYTKFNGEPAYLLAKSSQPTCQGDASGIGGGVKSGTIGKEVKPTSASSTIFIEGLQLVRQNDTCTMNNANTTGKYILT